jgi:hypothetical protein
VITAAIAVPRVLECVETLKGYVVERKKGQDEDDDLDCPLRVGSTLILAEAKGHRMNYETEAFDRRVLAERWDDICAYAWTTRIAPLGRSQGYAITKTCARRSQASSGSFRCYAVRTRSGYPTRTAGCV